MTTAPPLFVADLPTDHPGFADPSYRARRDEIAALATALDGEDVRYTQDETEVWRAVRSALDPLHDSFACRRIREASRALALPVERIPSLRETSGFLRSRTGFRMSRVAGLVPPREFLAALADSAFLSTEYVRHPSRPHARLRIGRCHPRPLRPGANRRDRGSYRCVPGCPVRCALVRAAPPRHRSAAGRGRVVHFSSTADLKAGRQEGRSPRNLNAPRGPSPRRDTLPPRL